MLLYWIASSVCNTSVEGLRPFLFYAPISVWGSCRDPTYKWVQMGCHQRSPTAAPQPSMSQPHACAGGHRVPEHLCGHSALWQVFQGLCDLQVSPERRKDVRRDVPRDVRNRDFGSMESYDYMGP